MDINAIRAKLDALNSDNDREKIDFSKIFWKPEFGKQTIRIVPAVNNPAYPFTELKFHFNIGKFPMIALSNFGKQDPIDEFVKELRKTDDKDNWSLSGKLNPKLRIYAPVIVRGEEDQGVRLYGFGVTIYKALLALAEDEDIGDFTDVINGWDLVVDKQKGNPYPETSVRIKPKQTPLSEDNKQVELWLKEQPIAEESFTQYSYDHIKTQLKSYLDPNAVEEKSQDESPFPSKEEVEAKKATKSESLKEDKDLPEALGKQKTDFTLETATENKKGAVAKFDDLFN